MPRVSASRNGTIYRTSDGEFEAKVSNIAMPGNGGAGVQILFTRRLPDPTPTNVFDDYRFLNNTFGYVLGFDPTKGEASVDIPRLRTALDSFATSTVINRLIAGEK